MIRSEHGGLVAAGASSGTRLAAERYATAAVAIEAAIIFETEKILNGRDQLTGDGLSWHGLTRGTNHRLRQDAGHLVPILHARVSSISNYACTS